MDRLDKINQILDEGLRSIDEDLNVDKDIREYSQHIATKLVNVFDRHVVNEYIVNEFGEEKPYMFVLLEDVDRRNGSPLLVLQVSDVTKVQEIAMHNMSPLCEKPAIYTPATYSVPKDDSHSKEELVQTLVSTAVAKIKGRFKVEALDDEEDTVSVSRGR